MTTISSIVADLISSGLLRESGPSGHRIGRPATMLASDGESYATIGIAVGSGHLTAMAVDLLGSRLLSWHRSFAPWSARPGPRRRRHPGCVSRSSRSTPRRSWSSWSESGW
ncbi:hypothetical protein [Nonomuraea sp. CA-141351]|uniref:hypothetical protein n=1 Tax=Nonomuraea sp. CA-141351 TaxID=3239996 RepID=UPI003D8DDF98